MKIGNHRRTEMSRVFETDTDLRIVISVDARRIEWLIDGGLRDAGFETAGNCRTDAAGSASLLTPDEVG